ncbi:MAG: DUF6065 family protein [Caulobacteraceae bacterium]
MELKCYVYPGWNPRLRPASPKREWMDRSPESFAYRCLPLSIANSHGWEILNPCGFTAEWKGGLAVDDVVLRIDEGSPPHEAPTVLFGQGTFTFHVQGLFRTPPGWNLWVGPSPNSFKDGACALSAIIETDWAPFTFTMNWRLTRPGFAVRFEAGEPIAHIFPVERSLIEAIEPRIVSIEEDPELKAEFEAWSASRNAFQERVRAHPPGKPADKWQKTYYRGQTPSGKCPIADHQTKLRVQAFVGDRAVSDASVETPPHPESSPVVKGSGAAGEWRRAKYEWLLATMERQRGLSAEAGGVFRVEGVSSEDFLDLYYAPARPVVLAGEIAHWPAPGRWSPEYLAAKVGSRLVEFQGGRTANGDFERDKDAHKRTAPFDRFIEAIIKEPGNDAYITAYNSAANQAALAPLDEDIGPLEKFLDHKAGGHGGMLWIGPAGTVTSLHHDLTNNLLVQITGRKRVILASAAETPKLYNDRHVFSEIKDVTDPNLDLSAYPALEQVRFHDITLEAGEALFIPIGWWHQVTSLEFSVTATFTNFLWPNDGFSGYPAEA